MKTLKLHHLSYRFFSQLQKTQRPKIQLQSGYNLFINGQFVPAKNSETFPVINPHNGETICEVALAQPNDVDKAVENAYETFEKGIWKNMDIRDRSQILSQGANLLKQHIEDIAYMESLQTGRPIREMLAQLQRLPEWLDYYAALIRTQEGSLPPFKGNYLNYVKRIPLGVIAQITPWNHPMLIAIKKIAPAIATGNSVIVKPSELAPCSIFEFAKLMKEGGLPDGVLNVITGLGKFTGERLINHKYINKIDLTGGTETGKIIGSAAGHNLCYYTAELGGKAPLIIFDDMINRINDVVNGCAFASFIATGQTCIMGARLLIHEKIYDEVINKLVSKVKNIKCGHPQDINTQFGPVISLQQRKKIELFIENAKKEGASILCGGKIPDQNNNPNQKGYYFEPTIIGNCNPKMKIVQEEVFGPVVVCLSFKNEQEAIELANDSPFGLAAGIWTNSMTRAHRVADKLNVGIIWINDHHRNDPSSPWGGMKQSGLGRENGIEAFYQYTQTKSVVVNLSDEPFDWFINKNNVRYS